jgi:hypothetical protein
LVIAVIRAHQERILPRLTIVMITALSAALVLPTYHTWKQYPEIERLLIGYFRIAKSYVEALKQYGPNDTVVVINDPVTWHSRIQWLTAVEGIDAKVLKVADFACPVTAPRLHQGCKVSLEPEEGSRRFRFTQDCGLEFCGTMLPQGDAVQRTLADAISADLRRERLPSTPHWAGAPLWDTVTLTVDRANVHLLYFDPATRRIEHVHVP